MAASWCGLPARYRPEHAAPRHRGVLGLALRITGAAIVLGLVAVLIWDRP